MESLSAPARIGTERPLGAPETRWHATPPSLPAGAVLRDRYRVTGTLEVGAVATRYRAEEVGTGRAVAVKLWHDASPDVRSRAESFGRLAARGAVPGSVPRAFVAVRDCALTADGRLLLVTELVEGRSLQELLDTTPGLDPARVVALAMRVGEALAGALDLGFPELRLSPADVMVVDAEDSVKILGSEELVLRRLGVAEARGETVRCDPLYAAPEELGGQPATERSAVYRFGMLLRALRAAERPSPADAREGIWHWLHVGVWQRSVSRTLDRLVARMTDPDAAARSTDVPGILNELWEASCRLEAAEPGEPAAPPQRWVLVAVPLVFVVILAWLVAGPGRAGLRARAPAHRPPPVAESSAPSGEAEPTPTVPPAVAIVPPRPSSPPPAPSLPPRAARPPATPAPPVPLPPPPPTRSAATPVPAVPAPPAAPTPPTVTATPPPPVASDAARVAVDTAPTTAAGSVPSTPADTGDHRGDPAAIIDWLLRQHPNDQ